MFNQKAVVFEGQLKPQWARNLAQLSVSQWVKAPPRSISIEDWAAWVQADETSGYFNNWYTCISYSLLKTYYFIGLLCVS